MHATPNERFLRQYNANVMDSFNNEFVKLERFESFGASDQTYIWISHCVYIKAIRDRLKGLREHYNILPLSSEDNKTSNNLCLESSLRK